MANTTAKVKSAVLRGVDAELVNIEVSINDGLPKTVILGLRDEAALEVRESVRAAIKSAGFAYPSGSVFVNVLPSCINKDGRGFELAIAMALLRATRQIPTPEDDIYVYVGALGIDGSVRAVRGMPSYVRLTEKCDYQFVGGSRSVNNDGLPLLPDTGSVFMMPGSLYEQLFMENLSTLHESTVLYECELLPREEVKEPDLRGVLSESERDALREAIVERKCRVIETKNASARDLLALAKYINYLAGSMTDEEIVETAAIRSAANEDIQSLLTGVRPLSYIVPSQTIKGVLGGGNPVVPGLLNLAHKGVAIIEDIDAFRPAIVTAMRSAFVQRKSSIVRASGSYDIPCDAILIVNKPTDFWNATKPTSHNQMSAKSICDADGAVHHVKIRSIN